MATCGAVAERFENVFKLFKVCTFNRERLVCAFVISANIAADTGRQFIFISYRDVLVHVIKMYRVVVRRLLCALYTYVDWREKNSTQLTTRVDWVR